VTRLEAIRLGLKLYKPDTPCQLGHDCDRRAPSGDCVECQRLRGQANSANRVRDNEKQKVYSRRYRERHRERERARVAETLRRYREEHPEKARAAVQASKKRNRPLYNAHDAKRRAMKAAGTPRWAAASETREIYKNARSLTELTGIEFQVDHIIPLVSDKVCGLHVAWNLQILTARENAAKHNRILEAA